MVTIPGLPASLPWKWIGVALAAIVVVSAVFFSIRAYGNARYDAGVDDNDAKWIAAGEALEEQSRAAAAAADKPADNRQAEFNEKLKEEKEKLDEASAAGTDPFDVLFGDDGV